MKAYVLHKIGNLSFEEVEVPDCKPGWALVKVGVAGICSSDIPRVFTKGTYHFPTILGHEFSGWVVQVGDDTDRGWVGKKIGVFPLIPCKHCAPCKERHYEMCEHYDYLGSRRDGGFAEYVAVPVWNLVEIPDTLPMKYAAMLEPVSVALHAVNRANIKQGSNVAVIGTGLIGICAAQWALTKGAGEVTVIGRNEQKRKIVEACNLDYVLMTDGTSVKYYDVVIEAVGSMSCVETAISLADAGGTVVLMGNPTGDITLSQDVYWRILRKQLVLTGTWNSTYLGSARSDWTDAIGCITRKQINLEPLVTHEFSCENLIEGLDLMRLHKETYCKVITIWNNKN